MNVGYRDSELQWGFDVEDKRLYLKKVRRKGREDNFFVQLIFLYRIVWV